jgi:hypothetical protein
MARKTNPTFDSVADELTATSDTVRSQMFGMPCLKRGGKAFVGDYHGAMVFKLRGEPHSQALALAGAHLFDPSGRDRPMKEWVVIPAEHAARWPELSRHALEAASAAAR